MGVALTIITGQYCHMSYSGLYINLDRSRQRRDWVENQLDRYHLTGRYRRFPAVDGALAEPRNSPVGLPEIGCFLSHYGATEAGLEWPGHLHVVEDDVLFSRRTHEVLSSII